MNADEKETHLYNEIYAVLNRHIQEYDLTHCQIIGVFRLLEATVIEHNRGEK